MIVTTSRYVVPTGRVKVPAGRYVVPTGRVKVPAGRYVVPTGKDNVIVSAGRAKVIPAGRTILVLVVLCLLRVDSINRPAFFHDDDEDDDEEYTIAITPILPTVEPDNSLSMGDEHLSTIPEKEESSVEDLVLIPSEFEGISDSMCDVSFCDNSTPLEASKDHYEIILDSNDEYSLSDENSLYNEDIDYIDASPPDSELVSLEEIEALKDNPTPSSDFVTKSPSTSPNSFLEETNILYNSLPDSETFCFNLEEKSSGNPTSYTNLSLSDYEAFFCDSKPNSGDFTMDVVEDIFDNLTQEPRVHVPNVLPTHPTLHLDSDFTLSSDSLGSDLVVSFPSRNRNKIFDPGRFIEVQSKRFLLSIMCDCPYTSIGRLCLGENNQGSLDEGIENKEQWKGAEFQDTATSREKKENKVFTFYRMEEKNECYFAPCYVGGLHAYAGEVNMDHERNLISNEFTVKLCLEYEEKNGEKLVKRELLVSLKGEFYFVKFIIIPVEDDVQPSVILGRSFCGKLEGGRG
ncbi:hypothetical protein Tco_0839106 [Tanacetum coccineum]|uniref:Uncharacterized protein n=1 Tax=Tanacetum coccineum TaxID=301880 RepID=A0ABQ5AUR5_9ASTR